MTIKWPIILLLADRLTAEETVVGRVFYLSILDATVNDNMATTPRAGIRMTQYYEIREYPHMCS